MGFTQSLGRTSLVFIFQKNDDHFLLNLLMRLFNVSGLPAQWKMGLTQSLLKPILPQFFDGFVGVMKDINKISYH